MTLVSLATSQWNAYLSLRNGIEGSLETKAGYTAQVRDVAVGDTLLGTRARVTAVGATSATDTVTRTITVDVRGTTATYTWPNGGQIWLAR